MANNTNPTAVATTAPRKKAKRSLKLKDISQVNLKEVEEKLLQARISLLVHQPFFGNMATRLRLIRAEEWCDTAATDGRNFYYNPCFIDSLTPKQAEFLFGHEVLHNVFEHLGRKDSRHHLLWNIAADYVVNQILIDNNIGKIIPDCLLDAKYKDWYAEQVYDDLNETMGKNGKNFEESMQELADKLLDDHLSGGFGDEDGEDGDGKGNGRPRLSDAERQKIRDEVRGNMIAAAAQAAGKLPAGVKRLVENLTQPKMNWRELLRQQVQSTIMSDFSYIRPNRKTQHQGIVIPGVVKGETISVCVAVDASGSISQKDVADFLTEVEGIMSQYDDYNIRIWSFDTQIYNDQTFTMGDGDVLSYEVKGGGGTSFNANWDYMKEHGIEPKIFVMFTDGYTGDGWGDEDYCETIFIIKHNPNCKPPHGIAVAYEEE